MIGAENAKLFETGQYGNLYIVSGSHARGATLHVQILPDGEKAIPNGSMNPCINKNAVMVYGVVSGNPGWTEEYGWLHEGPWVQEFNDLVKEREAEIRKAAAKKLKADKALRSAEEKRIQGLLSSYKKTKSDKEQVDRENFWESTIGSFNIIVEGDFFDLVGMAMNTYFEEGDEAVFNHASEPTAFYIRKDDSSIRVACKWGDVKKCKWTLDRDRDESKFQMVKMEYEKMERI